MKARWLMTAITLGISSVGLGISDARAVLRTHASQCVGIDHVATANDVPTGGAATVVFPSNGQVIHLDTANPATLICPVELIGGSAEPSVTIDVWKNSPSGVKLQLCHTFKAGGGGFCGSTDNLTGTGITSITLAGGMHSDNYSFIKVTMSACNASGTNCNVFFGYSY
jgi:hypothetical protein